MAIVVIGGQSREVGKTSVVAELIAALRELEWTAVKITQFGHGICSINGKSCGCGAGVHRYSISEERDPASGADTSRFLAAGARRSLWVRTKQGRLAEAMPELQRELAGAHNAIIESNSLLQFLRPQLYISVLDPAVKDFKASAREFLDRADAIVLRAAKGVVPGKEISLHAPVFPIEPPPYVSIALLGFVKARLAAGSEAQAPSPALPSASP